jgi:hypothetical protein
MLRGITVTIYRVSESSLLRGTLMSGFSGLVNYHRNSGPAPEFHLHYQVAEKATFA